MEFRKLVSKRFLDLTAKERPPYTAEEMYSLDDDITTDEDPSKEDEPSEEESDDLAYKKMTEPYWKSTDKDEDDEDDKNGHPGSQIINPSEKALGNTPKLTAKQVLPLALSLAKHMGITSKDVHSRVVDILENLTQVQLRELSEDIKGWLAEAGSGLLKSLKKQKPEIIEKTFFTIFPENSSTSKSLPEEPLSESEHKQVEKEQGEEVSDKAEISGDTRVHLTEQLDKMLQVGTISEKAHEYLINFIDKTNSMSSLDFVNEVVELGADAVGQIGDATIAKILGISEAKLLGSDNPLIKTTDDEEPKKESLLDFYLKNKKKRGN